MKPALTAVSVVAMITVAGVAGYYLYGPGNQADSGSSASLTTSATSGTASSTTTPSGSITATSSILVDPLKTFGSQVATVVTGDSPYGLAYDPDSQLTLVSVSGSDCVYAIGPQNEVVADIALGTGADFIAYDQNDSLLYASLIANNSIAVINTTRQAVVAHVATPTGPGWLAYDPASGTIYAVNREDNTISVVSGTAVVTTISLTGLPFATAYDPSDGDMYVTSNIGSVFVINGTTNALTATVQVGTSSSDLLGIAYNPTNARMYVTSYSDDAVYEISGTQPAGQVSGFDQPIGIAFSSTNPTEMFVVNSGNNTLSAVWQGLSSTVPVGNSPREVVYNPSTGAVAVSDYGNTTLTVLGP